MKPTPQLFRYVRPLIAIAFVIFSFGFLFTLTWRAVPVDNKDLINTAGGYVLGVLSMVMSYYFGASKDKSDQDQAKAFADTQDKVETAVVNAETATVNTNTTT